jgi:hypothetical protein
MNDDAFNPGIRSAFPLISQCIIFKDSILMDVMSQTLFLNWTNLISSEKVPSFMVSEPYPPQTRKNASV